MYTLEIDTSICLRSKVKCTENDTRQRQCVVSANGKHAIHTHTHTYSHSRILIQSEPVTIGEKEGLFQRIHVHILGIKRYHKR